MAKTKKIFIFEKTAIKDPENLDSYIADEALDSHMGIETLEEFNEFFESCLTWFEDNKEDLCLLIEGPNFEPLYCGTGANVCPEEYF